MCRYFRLYTVLCVMSQLSDEGQNEFVKNYLKQREQLMSQQMEQKKYYEGATLYSLILLTRAEIQNFMLSTFLCCHSLFMLPYTEQC